MRPKKTQSEQEVRRRTEVVRKAEEQGIGKLPLALAIGVPESTLRLWWSGKRSIDEAMIRKAEAYVGAPPIPLAADPRPAAPQSQQGAPPEGVSRALEVLERMAGTERLTEVDLRALCKSQSAAAIGTLVRLMVGSKSDQVKLRAAEILVERGWGKAGKGDPPRPKGEPMGDGDLMAILERLEKAK